MQFAVQKRGTYQELLEAAGWAEGKGLAAFAVPDHYVAGRADGGGYDTNSSEVFSYLGGLARETETVELVVLVSPVSYRHPAHLLKAGLALDEMSHGRFRLGVGTGWLEAEHSIYGFELLPNRQRFDRLEEALGYLEAAKTGTGFTGTHFTLEAVEQQPEPINLRLVVGGSGARRTPELAGRFADEFNVYSQLPADMAVRIKRCRESATAAGREPDAVQISSAAPPVIGKDQTEYRQRLERLAADRRFDVDKMESNFRKIGVPLGTHTEAQQAFGPLADLGVSRYYIQLFGSLGLDYGAEVVEVLSAA